MKQKRTERILSFKRVFMKQLLNNLSRVVAPLENRHQIEKAGHLNPAFSLGQISVCRLLLPHLVNKVVVLKLAGNVLQIIGNAGINKLVIGLQNKTTNDGRVNHFL